MNKLISLNQLEINTIQMKLPLEIEIKIRFINLLALLDFFHFLPTYKFIYIISKKYNKKTTTDKYDIKYL